MYDFAILCQRIQMPQEVTNIILSEDKGDPKLGFQILTDHLHRACECWETYQELGLSEEIYIDTMGCFSRFVKEHMVSFGCYGFDRGFWTTRQISIRLFRIGQLEYELREKEGKKQISLHIPSDCKLLTPLLRESYDRAKELLNQLFPDYAAGDWVCGSWLLSPNLKDLLPEGSNILNFQKSFTITDSYADPDFKEWVYKRTDIPDADLPENTSLQRSIKAFLLAGGCFLSAKGPLIADPFR